MKSYLVPISSQQCERVINHDADILIRKSVPKGLYAPFKGYLYCTMKMYKDSTIMDNRSVETYYSTASKRAFSISPFYARERWGCDINSKYYRINGRVIGEFICDDIAHYESEFWDDDTYEKIVQLYEPEDFNVYGEYERSTVAEGGDEDYVEKPLFIGTGLSWNEMRNLIGTDFHEFWGLHITDLKIYDKPHPLFHFFTPCNTDCVKCKNRLTDEECAEQGKHKILRAPSNLIPIVEAK